MSLARMVSIVCTSALLHGCTTAGGNGNVAASESPPVVMAAYAPDGVNMRWSARPEGAAWTAAGRDAVTRFGGDLTGSVPADIAIYCPGYAAGSPEQRRDFWVGLMSALARWESNYRPEVSFEESFNDSSGRPVVSRGLLQLSQESANGYGCGISDAQQLHDPATNLACGVRILNRQVTRAGRISTTSSPWRGAAAYWSPFRNAEKRADIAGWTAAQQFCTAG